MVQRKAHTSLSTFYILLLLLLLLILLYRHSIDIFYFVNNIGLYMGK